MKPRTTDCLKEIPKELEALKGKTGTLVKTEAFDHRGMVIEGDAVTGEISFVEVLDGFGVRVQGDRYYDYIRTSPVVKILDATERGATFQTQGGVYKLELKNL